MRFFKRNFGILFLLGLVILIAIQSFVPAIAQTYSRETTITSTTNDFLSGGAISPGEARDSFLVRSSPAGLVSFLASVRNLPSDAKASYLASYDLRAGVTYTLDLGDLFGLSCGEVNIYKVNIDGSAGSYTLGSCEGDVLTITHRGSNATFLFFAA